jgi:hypothetical protein
MNMNNNPEPAQAQVLAEDPLRVLLEAMEELPEEEKAAYAQAAEKCPQLIRSETDSYRFLQHTKGNALEAAKLLAKQWALRLESFQERAFLPLGDLSSGGALSEEDIKYLMSGHFAFLPNDAQGRTVLFANPARNSAANALRAKDAPRNRCFFFMLSRAAGEGRPVVSLRFGEGALQQARVQKIQVFLKCFPVEFAGRSSSASSSNGRNARV